MNLRTRMIVWIGLLLAVTVAGAGGLLFWWERTLLLDQMDRTRLALMDGFVQSCRDARIARDDLAALNAAAAVGRSPGILAAYVTDAAGRVVAHADAARIGGPEPATTPDGRRMSRHFSVGSQDALRAVLVYSRSFIDGELRRAQAASARRIGLVMLVALALGWGGAVILAGGLTRPIHRLIEATRELAEGKLDHRLNFKRSDELGRLIADFDRMAARLGELDAMKNDFVANVTHELRSPLSAIGSYVNLMAEQARDGQYDKLMDHLTVVRNNATRLEKFINDILDLSKIEARGTELRRMNVEAADALREAAGLFAAKAKEKNVTLEVEDPAPGLSVFADPDKLQQIMVNLVGNALKFTPSGGRIQLAAQGGHRFTAGAAPFARLSVSDTGPGIAPEDQARIFNRFEQVREQKESIKGAKGTGLGLSIAKGLVEAHGGRVTLVSELGKGSVFSVFLPEAG
jgi:signal transduction histidine kinase